MTEEWRDISGYEGLYQVSNLGRVKSFYNGGRILNPERLPSGYLRVNLYRDDKKKRPLVHRLVAMAFITNPESKREVNHINGIKSDNRAENLEWCIHVENVRHAWATGLKHARSGEDCSQAKLTNEQARFIRDNPGGLMCKQLAEMFGVKLTTISEIQTGKKYKNAGGDSRKAKPKAPTVPQNVRDEIRRLFVKGSREFGSRALAKKFGVAHGTILRIVNGK